MTAGQAQGIIGVVSTAQTMLLRRADIASHAGPALGIKKARDLKFQVDLKELAAASRPPPVRPLLPIKKPPSGDKAPAKTLPEAK